MKNTQDEREKRGNKNAQREYIKASRLVACQMLRVHFAANKNDNATNDRCIGIVRLQRWQTCRRDILATTARAPNNRFKRVFFSR